MPHPLDADVGVGARLGSGADGGGERGPVGSEAAPLHRDRVPATDPQHAPGQQPPPGAVDPLDPAPGQLAVLGRDDQAGRRDTDDGAVHGRQLGPAGRRCGVGHGSPSLGALRSGRFFWAAARPGPGRPPGERPRPRPGHGPRRLVPPLAEPVVGTPPRRHGRRAPDPPSGLPPGTARPAPAALPGAGPAHWSLPALRRVSRRADLRSRRPGGRVVAARRLRPGSRRRRSARRQARRPSGSMPSLQAWWSSWAKR